MSANESDLEKVREEITEEIPDDLSIDRLVYEGPRLVLYMDTPRKFAEADGIVPRLARTFRKRITVRPTSKSRTDPEVARSRLIDSSPKKPVSRT